NVAAAVPGGWRNVPSQPQRTSLLGPHGQIDVSYRWTRSGVLVDGVGEAVSVTPDQMRLEADGGWHTFSVVPAGDGIWVNSPSGSVNLTLLPRLPIPVSGSETGSLIAPMPGSVTKLAAAAGDSVNTGQLVLVIEAMKMEHQITAPTDGVLTELRVDV